MKSPFPSSVTEPKTRVCTSCRRQRSITQFKKLETPGNAAFPVRDRVCDPCKKAPPQVAVRTKLKEFHECTPAEVRAMFRIPAIRHSVLKSSVSGL